MASEEEVLMSWEPEAFGKDCFLEQAESGERREAIEYHFAELEKLRLSFQARIKEIVSVIDVEVEKVIKSSRKDSETRADRKRVTAIEADAQADRNHEALSSMILGFLEHFRTHLLTLAEEQNPSRSPVWTQIHNRNELIQPPSESMNFVINPLPYLSKIETLYQELWIRIDQLNCIVRQIDFHRDALKHSRPYTTEKKAYWTNDRYYQKEKKLPKNKEPKLTLVVK